MRKIISIAALTLALTCSTYAGDMQNDSPKPPPPPPPAPIVQQPTTNSDTQNDAADTLTQIVLDLLAILPSLR